MSSDLIRSTYRGLWWALMLRGLFAIALGAFILWRPIDSLATFALVIAFWAMFSGFVEIIHSIDLRRVYPHGRLARIGGLVSVGFGIAAFGGGVVAFLNPPATLAAILGLISGFALLSGVLLVMGAFRLSSLKHQLIHSANPARLSG